MKIIYITNARLPTEWAHGLQIMKTCAALKKTEVEIECWTPARRVHINESPFSYYRIEEHFPILRLFTIDSALWGKSGFLIQILSFALSALFKLFRQKGVDAVYCRDEVVASVLLFFRIRNVIWESHDGVWNRWARYVAHNARSLVVVSNGLKEFYVKNGVTAEKINVIRNGIDLAEFEHVEHKDVSRQRLSLPQEKKIALYVGMLQGWKGTDVLAKSSAFLPHDVLLTVIGGEDEKYVNALSKRYPQIRFLGYRPQGELPDNLSSADVLVLSNTAKNEISARFTSPLKLFAYMASGKPIVLPDIPSLREILDENMAYFVEPDNSEALAAGITEVLKNTEEAGRRAEKAYERAKEYTWDTRAKKIMSFIMR